MGLNKSNSNLGKSRHISIQDYYTILNHEFLCYFLRMKIYERPEDIKKFVDICNQKKDKILSISNKNCLPNIFHDKSMKSKYVSKLINHHGLPNFLYRDDYQKSVKGLWDKKYYFKEGIEVGSWNDKETDFANCTILKNYTETDTLLIQVKSKKHVYNYSDVQRSDIVDLFDNLK